MSLVEQALEGLHAPINKAVARRYLSAWGTPYQVRSHWTWEWSGYGLALPELLPAPLECVSAEAAWSAMASAVAELIRPPKRRRTI